ncbi:restriction endonuclease subunit S [Sporocytophaga myxococcoides]|uniref:restriction endonuclease subunit S n=1 Tax=Sporocytophaga myxococcoides TaxID=153721 RepID=UPI0004145C9F|nr:restriction endonuclease subunit S [Sporocytophaga myxococcoides]
MSKDQSKLIPELRFPEFENLGEWEKKMVEKLIQENILFAPKDGNHGNIHPKSSDYVKSGIPFIMASDLQNGKIDFSKCTYIKKAQADSLQKGFSESGDVLLSHKGTVGEVALLEDIEFPYIMLTPQVTYYRVKDKSKMSNTYLAAFFHSDLFQKSLLKVSGGGTRAYVGITEQQKLEILYPNKIEEQQKIASFLSSLDEVIAAHNQKLELLKDHKKGLMQNLFPQEGETVPRYRFPEFVSNAKWVERELNFYLEMLTDFEANGSFADVKSNVTVYDEPNFAWYVRATDLENNSSIEKLKFVDQKSYGFLRKTSLFGGELLITKRGEIGKVYFFDRNDKPATVGPNLYLLKMNEKAFPKYFYYYFRSFQGNQSLKKLNSSSTIGALYKDDVKRIRFLAPQYQEQQKIATCLSSLDALITTQVEKVEQLEQHKIALTQGLFPKVID